MTPPAPTLSLRLRLAPLALLPFVGALALGLASSRSAPAFALGLAQDAAGDGQFTPAGSPPPAAEAAPLAPAEVARLERDTDGAAEVSYSRATGAARFVALPAGLPELGVPAAAGIEAQTEAFLASYGAIFGIRDPGAELVPGDAGTDELGMTHQAFSQVYRGVPVYAGLLRAHTAPDGSLVVVNGSFIPGIVLDPAPVVSAAEASTIALSAMAGVGAAGLGTRAARLYVYRLDLARGVPGANLLAYEVEVTNGRDVREMVYVDAHSGKVVDRYSALTDALDRLIYDGAAGGYDPADPTLNVIRREGEPATGIADADGIYEVTGQTYQLYNMTWGHDAYDGKGATMRGVHAYGAPYSSPNAFWDGASTNFWTGVAGDDTVGHEWTHAYTEYTHGLIYRWQPGALNEAYSDIFGETVDLLNETGIDTPDLVRHDDRCTTFRPPAAFVNVTAPAAIAGKLDAGPAGFGPTLIDASVSGRVTMVDDGQGNLRDACQPVTNTAEVQGKIALIYTGGCSARQKVENAQAAGASGVIIVNAASDVIGPMRGLDLTVTIPSVYLGKTSGDAIQAALPDGVDVTLGATKPEGVESVRWMSSEDDPAFGWPIRDMWNPSCNGDDAGKVSDALYWCTTGDGGGVHSNSGIPNHAFALTVDGGTYNERTITGLGLTKAAHIYWRAMSNYQVAVTDFPDHADALAQSCQDLVGTELKALATGLPSGQSITLADCTELAKVIEAVEFDVLPKQCNFRPLLTKGIPSVCPGGNAVFSEDFESGAGAWTAGRRNLANEAAFAARDWTLVDVLPGDRPGSAFNAPDPVVGDCDVHSEAGVLTLTSPVIALPGADVAGTRPILSFWHYVSTEDNYDGGNVKVSVNGGEWRPLAPRDYLANAYNGILLSPGPDPAAAASDDPLAGEFAFHGSDGGTVEGSWGESQIDLSRIAKPGDSLQLRFELGSDGCNGNEYGWYVDDVRITYCALCGNKALDAGETCDDGNWANGDGCTASCQIEPLYTCDAPRPGWEAVMNPSFEAGTPNPVWQESASTARGTPLCKSGDCPGALALIGDWWASFGHDVPAASTAALTQTLTIPRQAEELELQLMAPVCSAVSTLTVSIDATAVLTVTAVAGGPACGNSYRKVSADISAFADDQSHTLRLASNVVNGSGFLVDLVSIGAEATGSFCRRPPSIYLPYTLWELAPPPTAVPTQLRR